MDNISLAQNASVENVTNAIQNISQQLVQNVLNEHKPKEQSLEIQDNETLVISFVLGCLIIGSIFRQLNKKFGIPYTPVIFFIGLVAGMYSGSLGVIGESLQVISKINPHGLLQIFLPILVFEAGFNLDWHIFRTELPQILILAFPCVIINAMIMMTVIKVVLCYEDTYYTWIGAYMFGSIVSCTDPIAVVALLKELGASKKLNTLIEGESLLNDAVGMVLFQVGSAIYKGQSASPGAIIQLFCSLAFGGILLGFIVGVVCGWLISKVYNDDISTVNVTLLGGFVSFFLAETVFERLGIPVSGIMAIIACGVYMSAIGRTKINPESEHSVHAFWHYIVFAAETTIFILAGVIVGNKVILDPAGYIRPVDYQKLFYMYLIMNVSRLISLGSHYPLLKSKGYGLELKEFIVIVYGGLRGAVGIAFAMIASADPELDPVLRDIFLFDMSGCAVLTLIINASTTGNLINYFGILNEHRVKDQMYKNFLQSMIQDTKLQEEQLRNNSYMSLVDWDQVYQMAGINQINKEIAKLDAKINQQLRIEKQKTTELKEIRNRSYVDKLLDEEEGQISTQEKPLLDETRSRYISILKQTYAEQFHHNQSNGETYLLLESSVNWDQDRFQEPMSSWNIVSSNFYKTHYIKLLHDMRKLPIIGGYIRNIVFNHISFAYNVVVSYVLAHQKAEAILQEFTVNQKLVDMIMFESEKNREDAEHYLHQYLMLAYPEITKSLQTKKASQELIQYQKHELLENKQWGNLDDKEYQELRNVIDEKANQLQDITPDFQQENTKQFLSNIAMFHFISDSDLDRIYLESKEKTFEKNYRIIKENDIAKFVYIIIRGVGEESCSSTLSHMSIDKTAGEMIGNLQLIADNKNRYMTSFVTDTVTTVRMIPISLLRKVVKQNKELESFLWKNSFFQYIRVNVKHFQSLAQLDFEEVNRVLTYCKLERVEPGEIVDISNGCIFLEGLAKQYQEGRFDIGQLNDYYVQNMDEVYESILAIKDLVNFQNPKFVKSGNKISIVALKTCYLYSFTNSDEVHDIIYESLNNSSRETVRFSKFVGKERLGQITEVQQDDL